MTRTLQIDPRVLAHAEHTAAQYERERPGHGPLFRRELDQLFAAILEHPEMYQRVQARYRRAFNRRFSFVVVYRLTADAVQIVGLVRQETNPAIIHGLVARP